MSGQYRLEAPISADINALREMGQHLRVVAGSGELPFGGDIYLNGSFGDLADTDFYELEISADNGATYEALMADEIASFSRRVHWISGAGSVFQSVPVLFAPTYRPHESGGARLVYETRKHYEETHDPSAWNASRFWGTVNLNLLAVWRTRRRASDGLTSHMLADGTYRLRVNGYRLEGGVLKDDHGLPVCATESQAWRGRAVLGHPWIARMERPVLARGSRS